jgi:hypothetical protein
MNLDDLLSNAQILKELARSSGGGALLRPSQRQGGDLLGSLLGGLLAGTSGGAQSNDSPIDDTLDLAKKFL